MEPDPRVINNCVVYFPSRLIVACDDTKDALALYKDANKLLNTSTIVALCSALHIALGKPISLNFPSVFAGAEHSGRQIVVKLLREVDNDRAVRVESQSVQILGLDKIEPDDHHPPYCFVPTRAETVTFDHSALADAAQIGARDKKEYHALIMKRCVSTVSCAPHFAAHVILENAEKRILPAIERMHELGYVHLDIKLSNIFVDGRGNWWLGDFGSMRPEGELVYSSTNAYYARHCAFPHHSR